MLCSLLYLFRSCSKLYSLKGTIVIVIKAIWEKRRRKHQLHNFIERKVPSVMASLLSLRCVSAGLSYPLPQVQLVRPIFPSRFKVRMEASAVSAADGKDTGSSVESDSVIQYVVLRRDLIDTWPLGSVVTQGCHASVAAIWSHKDDPFTLQYCDASNLDSMHKVTLEVKGQAQIVNLSEKLKSGGIDHKLWIEQPENIPTCLATKPYPKSMVSSFFKKLKLCK